MTLSAGSLRERLKHLDDLGINEWIAEKPGHAASHVELVVETSVAEGMLASTTELACIARDIRTDDVFVAFAAEIEDVACVT